MVTPYLGSFALTSQVVRPARTSDVVSGLVNGLTYRFRVAAQTENGTGPRSSPTNGVTIGVPTAPTAVTAAVRAGTAEVRWKVPTATNGSPITGYVVTPYRDGVAQPERWLSAHTTSVSITGLTAGQRYTFRVAAKNHRGVGPQSNPSSAVMVENAASPLVVVQALVAWLL